MCWERCQGACGWPLARARAAPGGTGGARSEVWRCVNADICHSARADVSVGSGRRREGCAWRDRRRTTAKEFQAARAHGGTRGGRGGARAGAGRPARRGGAGAARGRWRRLRGVGARRLVGAPALGPVGPRADVFLSRIKRACSSAARCLLKRASGASAATARTHEKRYHDRAGQGCRIFDALLDTRISSRSWEYGVMRVFEA